MTTALPTSPPVSVVMSVLNEQAHVHEALRCVLSQDYPGEIDVVVALGPSRDRTDAIVGHLAENDARVRWVRNPSPTGSTPAGLNAAIVASRHPVVVRADGHALLPPDYVSLAVEALRRTGADNVGGVMAAQGITAFEQAVAAAMTSPLGVGAAPFHTGGGEGPVDTVYLGAFLRSAIDRVGGYDEGFLRAQDWEMNLRIRRSGGLVWFSPAMRVAYRPRSALRPLARQYFHYGRWRRVMMRRHHGTATVRYLAAPLALAGVTGGAALAAAGLTWGLVLPGGYLAAVLVGGLAVGRGLPAGVRARLPIVLATMHMSWGAGFLTSPRRLAGDAPVSD